MSAKSFIKELISQKEHSSLDFKTSWNEEDILKTVCAFLNTEGGWLKKKGDGPQTKYSKTKKKLPDIAR